MALGIVAGASQYTTVFALDSDGLVHKVAVLEGVEGYLKILLVRRARPDLAGQSQQFGVVHPFGGVPLGAGGGIQQQGCNTVGNAVLSLDDFLIALRTQGHAHLSGGIYNNFINVVCGDSVLFHKSIHDIQ